MAEAKAKNEAFLKQIERQRLSKPCNRIIDLRGKVPGECQEYEFGGKTHYLDDRGYLLAKQLLDRFNGQYTVGVYERLLNAMKTLLQNSAASQTDNFERPILLRDRYQVQFMQFDHQRQRKEPRFIFATKIQIFINDVLYHGTTIDITTSAIRVVLKRTFALDEGDRIIVNLIEFAQQSNNTAFNKVSYKIMKISHDELRTRIILLRNRHDNQTVTDWLDNWGREHHTPEYIDFDNELFNLANQFYIRLYCETLNKPIIWLEQSGNINKLHLSPTAKYHFNALRNDQNIVELSKLPIDLLLNEPNDYVMGVDDKDGNCQIFVASRQYKDEVSNLLNWHSQHPNSHILLLSQVRPIIELEALQQDIAKLTNYDAELGESFKQNLLNNQSIIHVTDITSCCHILESQSDNFNLTPYKPSDSIQDIQPETLCNYIQRKKQRYHIRTEIKLHIGKKQFELKTINGSENGLAINLPGEININPQMRLYVDYIRWQKATDKVKLKRIPFQVKNRRFWQGKTHLGLERLNRACAGSVNTFFTEVIALNKEKLTPENEHHRIALESAIYCAVMTASLKTIPIFMSMDNDNVRILQTVASTTENQSSDKAMLWITMQNQVRGISEHLRRIAKKPEQVLYFGLYCFLDAKKQWKIQSDFDFVSLTEKNIFLNQAIAASEQYFYHCSLTPIKTDLVIHQQDLYQQLLKFRSHSQHKVRQIRETLHSLFAVGELTDITDILSSVYH